jgi:hypothetical protein
MASRPDMIWQYARHLRRARQAEGMPDPLVTAEAWVSLNRRPPARLIDPSANLGAVDYPPWSHAPWILPQP